MKPVQHSTCNPVLALPEELAALNSGQPVCFEIFQRTHAPILLGVYGVSMATTMPLE